jgi:putative endonuclease
MEYQVYLLRCADGSYYAGVTNDVERRVFEHGEGHDPSCYTFKRRPLTLVYVVHFREILEAIAWEKTIKR